ncbi:MAG: DUF2442 domain-containing protein [Treponematales bacterium]
MKRARKRSAIFSRRLARPAFRKLKDAALFGKAHIEGGAVVWNDEIDIAPEALYEEGRPAGSPSNLFAAVFSTATLPSAGR